ncbi:MAG: hypothetical protein EBQ56_01815 [Proteobacteria bacterium]|nr:hypothetical protein [Pseudomonadota bacterium]
MVWTAHRPSLLRLGFPSPRGARVRVDAEDPERSARTEVLEGRGSGTTVVETGFTARSVPDRLREEARLADGTDAVLAEGAVTVSAWLKPGLSAESVVISGVPIGSGPPSHAPDARFR